MHAETDRIFRFAPSPNGELHLGHACSALLNHDMAQACGGTLLLRMEDTDTQRSKPVYEQQILDDLRWLGVRWTGPVRRQSDHIADYQSALNRLKKLGVVYPAAMSRREIADFVAGAPGWPRDPDGAPFYPGRERELDAAARQKLLGSGKPVAWRLDISKASKRLQAPLTWREHGRGPQGQTGTINCDPAAWGDIVLIRSDGQVAYHLAVVVDDALQQVTDIVRGHDLFHATSLHRLLQTLLGLPQPRYTHHHLLSDGEGRKLSKSKRDLSLHSLRSGHSPADIRNLIAESAKI
ncbi:MAG: tRNA glutamyl-Q(34) synthetase GluQRS [Alphaproteobacteria bacterium]|nr:tRNA glutamyl-Q(34) synthetase GluQRS [Alphaproteobacteria bacterium]